MSRLEQLLTARSHRLLAGPNGRRIVSDTDYAVHLQVLSELRRRAATPLRRAPAGLTRLCAAAIGTALTTEQLTAVEAMIENRICIVHGKPGTGKSTSVRTAAKALRTIEPGRKAIVAAFSARIAVTTAARAGLEGRTLHALTGVRPGPDAGPGRPLDPDLSAVFVDEAFSVDPEMLLRILRLAAWRTRIVFLGDPGQLLPISGGRTLHDAVEHGLAPVFELVASHRLAGSAHLSEQLDRIRAGKMPQSGPGLRIHRTAGLSRAWDQIKARTAAQLVSCSLAAGLSCVALTGTRHGPCGHPAVNRLITGSARLRTGDEVVTTQADPRRRWRNGERAVVAESNGTAMRLAFDDGRSETARRDDPGLAPGYAMSGHRAQGLEYDRAVVVLDRRGLKSLSRQYLASVLSRAPDCVLLTDPGLIEIALRRDDLARRAPILEGIIHEQAAKRG